MSIPATITLPGIVAHLERFLRPLAATAGEGIEIRQDEIGTIVSVCEGRHAATITTATAGDLEPILVDPAALADVDPSRPVKLYRTAASTGVIARPGGELASVAIRPGALPRSARDLADVVEGEIASGMTKTVFELDPRHLLAVAEAIVAAGAEKLTIVVAPRWNVLACSTETDELTATFLIAGDTFEEPKRSSSPEDGDDPLAFTIGERKPTTPRTTRRRKGIDISGIPESEIPW
jgi:hypothetical protein